MPAMDCDFCLQTHVNSPMYQESPSGQALQVQQPLCGCACPWLKNRNGEGAAHQCRTGTHVSSMVHTFLRSNVLEMPAGLVWAPMQQGRIKGMHILFSWYICSIFCVYERL